MAGSRERAYRRARRGHREQDEEQRLEAPAPPAGQEVARDVGNRAFADAARSQAMPPTVMRAAVANARPATRPVDEDVIASAQDIAARGHVDWRAPTIPSTATRDQHQMLSDLWKAATGQHIVGGRQETAGSAQRLQYLESSSKQLDPLLTQYGKGGSDERARAAEIRQGLDAIQVRAYAQQAGEIVSQSSGGGVGSVKGMADDESLKEAVHKADQLLADLVDAVNNWDEEDVGGVVKELAGSRKPITLTGPTGKPTTVDPRKVGESILILQGVLDGLNAVLTVADPDKRKELFTERVGWAEATRYGDVGIWALRMLEGVIASSGLIVAGVARLSGNTALADKAIGLSGLGLNHLTGVVSVLQVLHGATVLCDPKSTPEEKADATVEVLTGSISVTTWVTGILAGKGVIASGSGTAAGFIGTWGAPAAFAITGTWFSLKTSLEAGASFVSSAVAYDVNAAYRELQRTGDELARALDAAQKYELLAQGVAQAKPGSTQARGYAQALGGAVYPLQKALWDAMDACANPGGAWKPGTYRAIRKRFVPLVQSVTAAVAKGAPSALVIAAAAAVLRAMIDSIKDYPAVRADAMAEYKERNKLN